MSRVDDAGLVSKALWLSEDQAPARLSDLRSIALEQ